MNTEVRTVADTEPTRLDQIEDGRIGCRPLSSLYGKRSKSAEAAKARQIRQELALSDEQRIALSLELGRRVY